MEWIRVQTNLLSHPKFRKLSLAGQGLLINVWMIVSEHGKGSGEISSDYLEPDYLFTLLGIPKRDWKKTKQQLDLIMSLGLIERTESGRYTPHDWSEYQHVAARSDADRARAYREKRKSEQIVTESHTVTTVTDVRDASKTELTVGKPDKVSSKTEPTSIVHRLYSAPMPQNEQCHTVSHTVTNVTPKIRLDQKREDLRSETSGNMTLDPTMFESDGMTMTNIKSSIGQEAKSCSGKVISERLNIFYPENGEWPLDAHIKFSTHPIAGLVGLQLKRLYRPESPAMASQRPESAHYEAMLRVVGRIGLEGAKEAVEYSTANEYWRRHVHNVFDLEKRLPTILQQLGIVEQPSEARAAHG